MRRGFVVLFGLMMVMICFITLPGLYQDYLINVIYTETNCQIVDKEMLRQGTEYQSVVQVEYTVNKQAYSAWVPASRIYPTQSLNAGQALLDHYQVDSHLACWYDSADPRKVAIEKGYHYLNAGVLFSMLVFFIFLTLGGRVNPTNNSKATLGNEPAGTFEIKTYRFTREYIYRGNQPVTIELLPDRLKKMMSIENQKRIVDIINRNGKFVTLRMVYAFLLVALLLVCAGIMMVATYWR
jgi:hypothetical protein